MSASSMELVSVLISLAAFAFAAWLFSWVKKQPLDNERIIQVGGLIQQGARTFLRREFMVLARFCVCARPFNLPVPALSHMDGKLCS